MKQLALLCFAFLFFAQKTSAQSLVFQDSTFTEPVTTETYIGEMLIKNLNLPESLADFCGCDNCPDSIPDNFVGNVLAYVNDTASNDLSGAAQVCGVRIYFDHEYLGDLNMRLISPSGQSVILVGPIGLSGTTDFSEWDISFVPCSSLAIPYPGFSAMWSNAQPWIPNMDYGGSYYPATGCLEDFDTGPVGGLWQLEITDGQAVDVGNVHDFEIFFCNVNGLDCELCDTPPVANLGNYMIGRDVYLQDHSTNASGYHLDFGDGTSFTGAYLPYIHTYNTAGTYLLHLIASSACGTDTIEQIIQVNDFAVAEPDSGCAPLLVHITVQDIPQVEEWHWFLPGGTPAESFDAEPTVVYNAGGTYTATLVAIRQAPVTSIGDTLYYSIPITVNGDLQSPGFTVQVQGDSIIATNTTQGFTEYYWLLNDVLINADTAEQQIIQVDTPGIYTVTLFVANSCDTTFIVQSVPVIFTGIKNAENDIFKLLLLPNPNDGHCRLELTSPENLSAEIAVLNTAGQSIFTEKTNLFTGKNARDLDLSHLPAGFYLLRLQTAVGAKTISFIVQQ